MKWKFAGRRTRLNILGAVILLAGLVSAIWIYRVAGNDSRDILGYEQGNGTVYPVGPEDSKKYLRDLELYGGKANVLADEFRRWFIGLWQGRSLAFTVGGIAVFISIGFFYAANRGLSNLEPGMNDKNHPDRTG